MAHALPSLPALQPSCHKASLRAMIKRAARMDISNRIKRTSSPPVMEARRWLAETALPADLPLLNVSQAAPVDPPPEAMRRVMADALLTQAETHLYGPVLGLPDLRSALAGQISRHYNANVAEAHVAITSGCNQAFAATIATICDEEDEVLLPTPWYFNHKMWLDMAGISAVPLATDAGLMPTIAAAKAEITKRTRAIVLVTPNNPAGVEYPATLVHAFYDLAREHGLTLIVDETYRDFDSRSEPAHALFSKPDWDAHFVHLYSFSKTYRLTGHRVGAMAASPARLAEAEKFLDTVTICPSQIGQHAALWGIENLDNWVSGQRDEILARRTAITAHFPPLKAQGWQLLGLGAYFAYVRHPFTLPSDQLAQELLEKAGILCLPGTMFRPATDPAGAAELRIAFANVDAHAIATLFKRLSSLDQDALSC